MKKFSYLLTILSGLIFLATVSSCDRIKRSIDLLQADTAYNQANITKAIAIYKKLLKNDPDDPELNWKLGIAYFSNGERENVKKQIVELRRLKNQKLADDLEQLLH